MVKYEIFMIDDSYSIESNDIIFNPYGIWQDKVKEILEENK